jgi:hypothetical protein
MGFRIVAFQLVVADIVFILSPAPLSSLPYLLDWW